MLALAKLGITAGASQLGDHSPRGITGSFEGGNACLGKAGGSQLRDHSCEGSCFHMRASDGLG